jgi:hypothetical protein
MSQSTGCVRSADNITELNDDRSGIGAHWPFLSSVRRVVQNVVDIAEDTPDPKVTWQQGRKEALLSVRQNTRPNSW